MMPSAMSEGRMASHDLFLFFSLFFLLNKTMASIMTLSGLNSFEAAASYFVFSCILTGARGILCVSHVNIVLREMTLRSKLLKERRRTDHQTAR